MAQMQSVKPSVLIGLVLYLTNAVGILQNVGAYPSTSWGRITENDLSQYTGKTGFEDKEASVWKKDANVCPFDSYTDSIVMAGDVFDQYSVNNDSECKALCLHQTDFFCAAALIRSHTCYLTGFRMRRDYWSVHYVRTCSDAYTSSECFTAVPGWSAVHNTEISIPWFVRQSKSTRRIFCMALCAQTSSCVGFDLKESRSACYLMQLLSFDERLKFDVHIRRC